MSYQSKIAKNNAALKRKLRDHKVTISGDDVKVIRLKVTENKYHDREFEVVSHGIVTLILDIPSEIPITRLRTTLSETITTTNNTYLYDILPITGFARFEDDIEKGDVLIQKVYDEDDEEQETNYLWVLQVSDILGNFSHGRLSGRKFYCAPYNMALPTEVEDIINEYNTEIE